MRRFAFSLALTALALAIACNDDGLGPERYGSIVLRIVPAKAPAAPATTDAPQTAPSDAPSPARKPGMEARDGAEPDSAKTPPIDIARSPTAAAALERVQVSVDGPTPKSIDLTLNTDNDHWEGTVDGLDVGAYTVAVKGYVNSQVDSYGQTSGVQVRAGQETPASITNWGTFRPAFNAASTNTAMLRFTIGFQAVSTATGYDLEWADNAGFSNAQTISTTQTTVDVGQVAAAGEYHLRVRAKNAEVTAGRWSDEQVVVVEADTVGGNLAAAAYIGFGDGINGRRPTTNILPADDQDWYRFNACRYDTLTAETFAERLSPPSDLNTMLALRSVSGDSVVASNDDANGNDSRLDAIVLPSSGEYVVVVTGAASGIGAYDLELTLVRGPLNTGSDCASSVDHIVVSPGYWELGNAGQTAQFTAEAFDLDDVLLDPQPTFTWQSLNAAVATVDGTGLATSVASGQAVVEATADGVSGYGLTTVSSQPPAQVNLLASQTTPSSVNLRLWAVAADNLFAVGADGTILHWDGGSWNSQSSGVADTLFAAWGPSADQVFAAGKNGTILVTYDAGANWTPMTSGTTETLSGLWGSAPNDVFAVGGNGTILHYDGVDWAPMTSNTVEGLREVWGIASDDVYAVGLNSTVLHYDGVDWASMAGVPAGAYIHIWGTASNDFWAVGNAGLVAHYTGSWSTEAVPTASNLRGISGTTPTDVYVVSVDGFVLRYDGSTWDSLPTPTAESLFDVRAAPSGDVFVSGNNGTVLRGYRGAQLAFLSEPPSAVDPRTNFATSVEFRDASGTAISDSVGGTVSLGLSNNAGTVIHLSGGGPGGGQPAMFWRVDATTPIKGDSIEDTSGAYRRFWSSTYDPATGQMLASGLGSGGWSLLTIDPIDGSVTEIGTTSDLVKGLAWVDGVLWGPSAQYPTMYSVDPATGGLTSIGTVTGTTINGFNGIAVDPTDGTVFAVANPGGPGSQDRTLVTIDRTTFAATVIGPLEQWGVSSLAFMDDGTLLATTGSGAPIPEYVWIVDKTTGSMTPMLDATTPTVDGITIAAAPAHLSGTLSLASSSGVATFGDLQLDAPASGYTLVASYPYLADAFTGGFDVNIGPAPTTPLYVDITPQGGTIIGINDTLQLTATPYLYAGGSYQVASGATVTWSSADSAVAIAAQDGVVTGYATGVARIDVDEDGGNALSASVDVTVDPSFTGSISAATADFADQLTLTPGSGVTWTGAETVTIGGELPYIESQDASQIVLRVPSVPVGDAEVVIGNQEGIGFTQYDTISVTSIYTRPADPGNMAADSLLIANDTTFFISVADSTATSGAIAGPYSAYTLSPPQNTGYTVTMDWQTGADLDMLTADSAFQSCVDCSSGLTTNNPEMMAVGVPADTTWRIAFATFLTGQPQTMARITVVTTPTVGTSTVVGYSHSCMLDLSGNAYCWGYNGQSQLGDGGANRYTTSPVAVEAGGVTFTQLASGSYHTCGLTESGDAYCWGADWSGQIGDGAAPAGVSAMPSLNDDPNWTAPPRPLPRDSSLAAPVVPSFSPTNREATAGNTPTMVVGGHTFTQLSAGDSHTCGVTTGGDIYCWGYNYYGQLGDASNTDSPSPVAVVNPGVTFTQVAAGAEHTCALTNAGEVYCWGWNTIGQLGNNSQIDENTPVYVGTSYTSVIAGYYHSCALDGSGDLWCWGYGQTGEFGNGGSSNSLVPVLGASGYGFARVSAGPISWGACGITTGNVAYCWGENYSGQLGDGTTNYAYSPVTVSGGLAFASIALGSGHSCGATNTGDAYCWGRWQWGELGDGQTLPITPQTVLGSTGFTGATAGQSHTCALSGTTAYCWGYGGNGQLGTGAYTTETSPALVTGGYAFASLSGGQYHSCGVTTGGVGYCWGNGYYGTLGDGNFMSGTSSPALVAGGLTWAQIDAGDYRSTCGVTTTGIAYCWGRNEFGQLGHGTVGDSASVPDSVHTSLTFQQVSTGYGHACALTSTSGGDIWCWGWGADGQLGDGLQTDSPDPVQVDNLGGTLSFTAVRAGQYHTCATTTGNETYCWGYGGYGAIGDGTYSSQPIPTLVTDGHAFSDIEVGRNTSCALEGSTGYCWGYNYYGQVGNGEIGTSPSAPAAIVGGIAFDRVVTGGNHSCGTTGGGDMYCWGYNYNGQLGTGTMQQELSPVPVAGGIVVRAPSMMPVSTSGTSTPIPIGP